MSQTLSMDDRISILLVMAEHRDNPVIVETCEMWLRAFPIRSEPSFLELSHPEHGHEQ